MTGCGEEASIVLCTQLSPLPAPGPLSDPLLPPGGEKSIEALRDTSRTCPSLSGENVGENVAGGLRMPHG